MDFSFPKVLIVFGILFSWMIAPIGQEIGTLVEQLKSQDPKQVEHAIAELVQLGKKDSEVVSKLYDFLEDNDVTVRQQTVAILGEIGNSTSAVLLENKLKDQSELVRRETCLALLKIGPKNPEKLLELLKLETDIETKILLSGLLMVAGYPKVSEEMFTLTKEDGQVQLQKLLNVLPNASYAKARLTAISNIEKMEWLNRWLPFLIHANSENAKAIHAWLCQISQEPLPFPENDNPAEREKLVRVWQNWLLQQSTIAQIQQWIEDLGSGKQEAIEAAIANLQQNKDVAYQYILTSLKHSNANIRWQTLQLLGMYPEKKASITQALLPRLTEESDSAILRQIIAVVSTYAGVEAIPSLTGLMEHPLANIRSEAIWSLSLLKDPELSTKLVQRLSKEPVPEVKAAILRTLSLSQDTAQIHAALQLISYELPKEDKSDVLMAICDCAAQIQNGLGLSLLTEILVRPDVSIRKYALTRLLPLIQTDNVGLLIPALWDSDLELRTLAFQKLLEHELNSYGYDPKADLLERAAAIGRWNKWWQAKLLVKEFVIADLTKQKELIPQIVAQGESAIPAILDGYSHANPQIQSQFLKLLSYWETPEVVAHLQQVSQTLDTLGIVALESLAQIHARKSDPAIRKVLQAGFAKLPENDRIWLAVYLAVDKDSTALEFIKAKIQSSAAMQVLELMFKHRLSHPELNSLVAEYLKSSDANLQQMSFDTLANFQDWNTLLSHFSELGESQKLFLIGKVQQESKENLEKLISYVATETLDSVRIRLVEALGDVAKAQQDLLKLLPNKLSEGVLKALVQVLKKQKALPTTMILDTFTQQENPACQLFLIQSIPAEDLASSAIFLQPIITGNYSEQVSTEALQQLLKVADADVAKIVLDVISQKQNTSLRLAWLILIKGKIKESHFAAIEAFMKKEPEASVRSAAFALLTNLPYDLVIGLIKYTIEQDPNLLLRKEALTQFVSYKRDENQEYLLNLANSQDSAWRQIVYEHIVLAMPSRAQAILEKALESGDMAAFQIFVQKFPAVAQTSLASILPKIKDADKPMFVQTIVGIVGESEIALLLSLLPSQDQSMSIQVAKLLDKITGITSNFDPLTPQPAINLWQDWHKQWQNAQQALQAYLAAKEEQREELQKQLLSYGNFGRDALIKALQGASKSTTLLLLPALAKLDDPAAIGAIQYATQDKDVDIRHTAYQCLTSRPGFAQDAAIFYLKEIDPNVRITLFAALSKQHQTLHQNDLLAYIRIANPDIILKILRLSATCPLSLRRDILVQILNTQNDPAILEQALIGMKPVLQMQDIEVLATLLKRTTDERVAQKTLELLAQYTEIPKESLADPKAFLAWKEQNAKSIAQFTQAGAMIEKYLSGKQELSLQDEKQLNALLDAQKVTVVGLLLPRLAQMPQPQEKVKILNLLAVLGQATTQATFEQFLTSDVVELRHAGVTGLYRLNWDPKSDLVQKSVDHQDPMIRFFAIKTLGRTKDPAYLPNISKALADLDSRVREEALFWAKQIGFKDPEALQKLLKDPSPSVKTMAIQLAVDLKMTSIMGMLIGDLNHPFPIVRQAAYDALRTLSGQTIAYDPLQEIAKQKENLLKWQLWWQIYQLQQEIQNLAERFVEKDIDKTKVREKIVALYKESVSDFQKAALEKILQLLKDTRTTIRVEMIAVLAESGNRGIATELGNFLLDENLEVRQAAYAAIEKLTGTKPSVGTIAYTDDKGKEEWTNSVNAWLPNWLQAEQKLRMEEELKKLQQDAVTIATISRIWTNDHANAAYKLLGYLRSAYPDVRAKAFEYLKPLSKDIAFQHDATLEERNQEIDEIEKWITKTQQEIQQQEKELPEKLAELDQLEGDLNTLTGCENLRNSIEKMLADVNAHPQVQQKYVDILRKKGCEFPDYNIYSDSKTKEDQIYRADEILVQYKAKLKVAAEEAVAVEKQLQEALDVQHLGTELDIQKAEKLIPVLMHNHYPLRDKVSQILSKLAGRDFGYKPDAPLAQRQETMPHWQEWIQNARQELAARRQNYLAKIKASNEFLGQSKKVLNREDWAHASMLISALQDSDVAVREAAIQVLTGIRGDTFGYVASAPQPESLRQWQNWLVEQSSIIFQRETMIQNARAIQNAAKITTADAVAQVAILVQTLTSPEIADRQVAFEALSQYARTHAMNEVREDFGYDPKAPTAILETTAKDWQKWYQEKLLPIAEAEKQRLSEVKRVGQKVLDSKLASLDAIQGLEFLISSLNDIAPVVRESALASLKSVAPDTNYNYDAKQNPDTQKFGIKQWQFWLRKQKTQIVEIVAARQQAIEKIIARNPIFNSPEQEPDVISIINALNDSEVQIRQIAFQWLVKQSNQSFDFNPQAEPASQEKAKASIQEWVKLQKVMLTLAGYEANLGQGVNTEANIAVYQKVLAYLDDPAIAIGTKAFEIASKLAGNEADIEGMQFPLDKDSIKAKLTIWMEAQRERSKLSELAGSITAVRTAEDLRKVGILITALDSPKLSVRAFAIAKLNQLAPKPFAYQANDSTENRIAALTEIDQWYKKLQETIE